MEMRAAFRVSLERACISAIAGDCSVSFMVSLMVPSLQAPVSGLGFQLRGRRTTRATMFSASTPKVISSAPAQASCTQSSKAEPAYW